MIVEERLGCTEEATMRRNLTLEYLSSSMYWRTRFKAFDLSKHLGKGVETIIIEGKTEIPGQSFTADELRKSGGYVV